MPSASNHRRDWESHRNNAITYNRETLETTLKDSNECELGPTEATSFPGSISFLSLELRELPEREEERPWERVCN